MLFAIPVLTTALFLLTFQRSFGAAFFDVDKGADPLLWQHLFWIFGHPEVYILIMPTFGIISEVIPVFSRKPLFGYPMMVFSGVAIAFMGWGVWAHHMFASGLGPLSVSVFSVSTMAIAIPTGIKIVNWIMTMWGGKLRFAVPMMFAVGMIVEFTIGGLSGVTHAVSPSDTQQTDTYYIVAHIHYVLFGGSVLGVFAGLYYWWPKFFGKQLSERIGRWHFWLMIIGMNLTFGPMHILGLQGQPRRMVVWTKARAGDGLFNLGFWNRVSTLGAVLLAIGVSVFIANVIHTHTGSRRRAASGPDPWDARALEWMASCPPKPHNFDAIPHVSSLDEFFHRKYEEDDATGSLQPIATADELLAEQERFATGDLHMPSPSYWPIVLAAALPLVAYGIIYNVLLSVAGAAMAALAIFGWALEPSVASQPSPTAAEGAAVRTVE
jgi:cytochrome c oxidase subunit 1